MAALTHQIANPRINMTLTIKFGAGYRARMALAVAILKVAAWVMPHNAEVEVVTGQ